MDPGLGVAWALALASAFAAVLAAAYEATFAVCSRAELERLRESGLARAGAMLRIWEPRHRVLLISRSGHVLGSVGLALGLFAALEPAAGLVYAGLLSAAGCLACFLAASAARGLRFEGKDGQPRVPARAVAFVPLHAVLAPVATLVGRLSGARSSAEEYRATQEVELRQLVDAQRETGVLEEGEREMIHGVFGFYDSVVREVMVPRVDIAAVEQAVPLSELLRTIRESGHSRIPVYEESLDHIRGIAFAKDLLELLATHPGVDLSAPVAVLTTDRGLFVEERPLLRPPFYVPETKKTGDLFRELRSARTWLAIVVDEYGGTAGLVALEDLVEEIVGEMQDEYDEEQALYQWSAPEGILTASARIGIDELNELLGTDLPSEGFDTLGGFIYDRLGHVPRQGEVFQERDLRIEILRVDGHRIAQVRLRRVPGSGSDGHPTADANTG